MDWALSHTYRKQNQKVKLLDAVIPGRYPHSRALQSRSSEAPVLQTNVNEGQAVTDPAMP